MKQFLTALFLLTTGIASAQIVNIPDPGFKQFLVEFASPPIDINEDGEIQETEAQAITQLYITGALTDITDLTGIKAFINLDTLVSDELDITNLDLSNMTNLRSVGMAGGHIHSVDISNCSNLLDFTVEGIAGYNGDSITNMNFDGDHKLRRFFCAILNLQELDLRQCDSLVEFTMGIGNIQGMLNVSGMTKLERLNFVGHVGAINANNAINLESILGSTYWADGFTTEDLFLHNCGSLERMEAFTFNGTQLDLSSSPLLYSLGCNSPTLRYLNIKNGNTMPETLLTSNLGVQIDNPNPQPLYVCADDYEANAVLNRFTQINDPAVQITVNSFCSPGPGAAFNTIRGKVRVDVNNNGCDHADEEIANVPVRVYNGSYSTIRYSGIAGEYNHYDFTGNFTLTPYFPYPYFSISPTTASTSFATANSSIDTIDFCIATVGVHNQLEVTMLPVDGARPGFRSHYQLVYRNRGTTTLSGTVQLNYDINKETFYASSISPAQSNGQLSWSYNNLLPLQTRSIDVSFLLHQVPTNNMGDTLFYLATINPVTGDETPANNNFILPQGLTNSFDPNDKKCLEGNKIGINDIGNKLHYVIHFQNLGTDTAFTVVVTDTLTNNVDWESFDLIKTSHACDVKRVDNKLEFYFQNINLPHQAIDDAGSNGFVAFSVNAKNDLVIGDSINNRASIYFDFNPAVVTELATTIVSPTSSLAVKLEYFSLVNKNETNQLIWKATSTNGITDFAIERSNDGIHFTNIGNITATKERCQSPFNFTDEKPFNGKTFYRLNMKEANGVSFYSKILVAERTKSGLSITTAVVSDRNSTTIYLNAATQQNVQMKIIAADGRLVYNQTKTIVAGSSTMNLPLRNLSGGIYTLIVYTNDGEVITKRFVK